MPRQLPLALSPEPGEAVDSWLEALARMYHVTFGVLRERVGIDLHYPSWVAQLDEASINNLAESTRVAPETIQDLTLQHYRDAALNTHPDKPTVEQLLVRRYNRSRYCPACLDESNGRWLLSWRLGWTFACPQHHCLLLDRCPACGQWQRHLWPPSHLESAPGHCARFQESNDSQVCNADLRAAEPIILKPKHRLIIAHNTIAEVIDGGTDTCGIYREQPCSSYDFLRDLRYLALRFLSLRNTELAETVIDEPSTSHLYLQEACRNGGLAAADRRFTQSALATGAAAHVALTVLHADGPDTASQRMALVLGLSNRRPRQQSYLSECPSISDQLSAVRIKAYEPYLGTTAQLRYRAHTKSPCFPTIHAGQLPGLAQSVPRLFWIPTVFKFQIPGARLSTLRPFLSAALLMIGTTADRIDILRLLDDTHPAPARIEHVAGRLRHSGHWPAIAEALTRIHDALGDAPAPIDYTRRRNLDYTGLLSEHEWDNACCRAGVSVGLRRINFARCWLYEILSGNPPIDAPYWDHTIPAFRFQQYYDNFFPTLTEELTTQLHDIAHRYLQRCRIAEPLSWQPSPGLLDDLTLPGPEPNTVDPALIQIITEELPSLSTVAARLHTTTEIARYHLEAAPPARVGSSPNRYRAQIAKDDLLRLRAQGFSAQRIATVLGVSKPTIYAAARRHNVDISLRPYRITIDKDWLRTQIIDKHRSFAEIADELGVSESAVSRKAAKYGLPKPSEATRGCGTQRRNLATVRSLVRHLPDGTSPEDWITHALTKEKLSYAEAAARLGVQPQMIRRLARELGLPPAVRHSPGQSGRGRAARYSTQFRDKALAELDHLLHSEAALDKTRAVQKVADHLGIAECTLWKWSRQRDTSAAQSSANPVSQGTPKILAPAFRRRGANRRLTTLTRVAYYDTGKSPGVVGFRS